MFPITPDKSNSRFNIQKNVQKKKLMNSKEKTIVETKMKTLREIIILKNENGASELWDNVKKSNVDVIKVPNQLTLS